MQDAQTYLEVVRIEVRLTGEPDNGKLLRPVRRGAVGKVPFQGVTRWLPTRLSCMG